MPRPIGEAAERISSLTSTGSVVATLDYASPEQIKGLILGEYSDIYALGCVLYKLLTGIVPFPGDSVAARVYGHLNGTPSPPSTMVPGLPSGFDDVVAKALAKEPADRYPTCRALALAARDALSSPVRATRGYPQPTPPPRVDQRPLQSMPQWLGHIPGTRPEQVPVPVIQQYQPRPESPRPEQPPPAAAPPSTPSPPSNPSSNSTVLVLSVIVALLLVALVIVAAVAYLR